MRVEETSRRLQLIEVDFVGQQERVLLELVVDGIFAAVDGDFACLMSGPEGSTRASDAAPYLT